MTDTPEKKNILNSIHEAAQWCLHMGLVPVIALLKASIAGLQHIHDELTKI